jgi:hypothetical protein
MTVEPKMHLSILLGLTGILKESRNFVDQFRYAISLEEPSISIFDA